MSGGWACVLLVGARGVLQDGDRVTGSPPPPPNWKPNWENTGVYTSAPWHAAESTPFRFQGSMYVMESVEGGGGYFNTSQEGGSFFRIADLHTGTVLVNVSESIGHAFFSAVVDDARGVVWVFGAAHHRGWDNKGPCDDNSAHGGAPAAGCYVGVWNSTDLLHWSKTAKSVIFPGGNYTQNNDVTLVRPEYDDWEAKHGALLPRHQAAMALEAEASKSEGGGGFFSTAINIGTDGDLSRSADWIILYSNNTEKDYRTPEHACPALRYDPERGDYYLTGGGEVQQGPYRSTDLSKWTTSPLQPLTDNAVNLARYNTNKTLVSTYDGKIGPFMTEKWASLSNEELGNAKAFLKNVSQWSWGHSDFDWCCDDGKAPSYLLYMVTQQGHPANWTGKGRGSWFQAMGTVNLGIIEWLRSYFP
eukprot:gene3472-22402_t